MRGWVISGLGLALSGCSFLLSSDGGVEPPDDCPVSQVDRVLVFEGEGAETDEWSADPRLVGVAGSGLPVGGDLQVTDSPLEIERVTFKDDTGVLELRFHIDPDRPVDPAIPETEDVDLALFNADGACITVPLRLTYLPELELSGTSINGALLEPMYSVVRLTDVVGVGSEEIAVNAAGAIELRGVLDFSGDAGGAGGPGPAGGAGGETAANLRMGTFEGGGLPGNAIASGAGHAVAGEPGDNAGGAAAGHITLLRSSMGAHRGGHGGGGCPTEPGGHGGGVFLARASGVIASLEESTLIAVTGGPGAVGDCISGDGSAGAVFLGAPQIVTVGSALTIDIDGTPSAGGRVGASGGRLRVDSDDAAFVSPKSGDKISHWLGGGLVPPENRIVRGGDNVVTLEVFGGVSNARDNIGRVEIVQRVDGDETALAPLGPPPATVTADLVPGLNRLCVINHRHDADSAIPPIDEDVELATNCIEIGYVP